MSKLSTRKIVFTGLMIALVFVTTKFTAIPVGIGCFTIGDIAIYLTALLLGRNSALAAGALGSALSDLSGTYAYYTAITFVVKGIEGYIMGSIGYTGEQNSKLMTSRSLIALIAGVSFMIVGYFIGDLYFLRFVSDEYGMTTAMTNLPVNIIQAIATCVVGYALSFVIERSGVKKILGSNR